MTDANPIDWTGQKKVSLALQGGGSHGAFTWGVLDYLLEDARLDIEAIAGTSAGRRLHGQSRLVSIVL